MASMTFMPAMFISFALLTAVLVPSVFLMPMVLLGGFVVTLSILASITLLPSLLMLIFLPVSFLSLFLVPFVLIRVRRKKHLRGLLSCFGNHGLHWGTLLLATAVWEEGCVLLGKLLACCLPSDIMKVLQPLLNKNFFRVVLFVHTCTLDPGTEKKPVCERALRDTHLLTVAARPRTTRSQRKITHYVIAFGA
jgi:hypothetical protein